MGEGLSKGAQQSFTAPHGSLSLMAPSLKRFEQSKGGPLKLRRNYGFGEVSKPAPQAKKGENPLSFKTGTAVAIINPSNGVAVVSTTSHSRGGARNRADRQSDALTAAQICNLMAAERHARQIGLPFNRMITIHWQAAGLQLEDMVRATGRFIDLMTKALVRHGSKTAWLFVHENAAGTGHEKGGHVHLLTHIPADRVPTIKRLQMRWLRRITGRPYRSKVILSRPIGGRLGLEATNPELYLANAQQALSYLLKGASAEAAAQFTLIDHKAGGRVLGKRVGTSQNIGVKARAACSCTNNQRGPLSGGRSFWRMTEPSADQLITDLLEKRSSGDAAHYTSCWIEQAMQAPLPRSMPALLPWADTIRASSTCTL